MQQTIYTVSTIHRTPTRLKEGKCSVLKLATALRSRCLLTGLHDCDINQSVSELRPPVTSFKVLVYWPFCLREVRKKYYNLKLPLSCNMKGAWRPLAQRWDCSSSKEGPQNETQFRKINFYNGHDSSTHPHQVRAISRYNILSPPPELSRPCGRVVTLGLDWWRWINFRAGSRNFGWGGVDLENSESITATPFATPPVFYKFYYKTFTISLTVFEWLHLISQTAHHDFSGQPLGWGGGGLPLPQIHHWT